MKILAAFGCSFTENSKNPPVFKRWPDHLASHLNLTPVNLGESGYSNNSIADLAVEYILNNHKNIKHVAILWTDWSRFSFLNSNHISQRYIPSTSCSYDKKQKIIGGAVEVNSPKLYSKKYNPVRQRPINNRLLLKFLKNITDKKNIIKDIVKENIIRFNQIDLLCNRYNINYTYMQGVMPLLYDFYDFFKLKEEVFIEACLEYEYIFDKSKFIGWIPSTLVGGTHFDSLAKNNSLAFISKNNNHPSEIGHQLIAKEFIKSI